MNRAGILALLQAVDEHISSGERQITNRRDFVLSLKCAGCEAASEIAQLRELERAQREQIEERDRLRVQLEVFDAMDAARAQITLGADTSAATA